MRLAIAVVLLLVVGTSAQAQPLDPASAARQLYATGRVDFEAGRFKQAATAFHAAYALMPLPGLLFNEASSLRRAYELTGNRESAMDAIALYESFLATPSTNLVEAQEAAAQLAALGRSVAARPDQVVVVTRTAAAPRRTGLIVGLSVGAVVLVGTGLGLGLGLGLHSSSGPTVMARW